MGRENAAFLWGGLGILAAVIYFFVAVFLKEWGGIAALGVTVGLEAWLMKRWFRSDSESS